MKQLFLFGLCMCLAVGFTACSDDDEDSASSQQGTVETMAVTEFDQLKYFQNSIIEIDSAGAFVQRVCGVPLDQADTTIVSIGVEDLAEAKEIFMSWLAPDVEPAENGDVVMASLRNEDGESQGLVVFSPVSEDVQHPMLAQVTFSDDMDIRFVTKVEFVPNSSWPNNSISPFYVGDKVKLNTYDEGSQYWVCIRQAKSGQNGLLVYLSSSKGCYGAAYISNFASVSLAKEVAKITQKNWTSLVPLFQDAGMTLEDSYYWINEGKFFVVGGGIYSINLKTEHIDWWEIVWHNPKYRYLQVKTFGELN